MHVLTKDVLLLFYNFKNKHCLSRENQVYVNQDKSLTDLQTLIKHPFLLYFPRELLMSILNSYNNERND
jgi:hypothetical protein